MNSTLRVTEERPFEMHSERPSTGAVVSTSGMLRGPAERVERAQRSLNRSCYRRGTVARDAVFRHQMLDGGKACVGALHYVMSRTAVNVDINETGGKNRIAKI